MKTLVEIARHAHEMLMARGVTAVIEQVDAELAEDGAAVMFYMWCAGDESVVLGLDLQPGVPFDKAAYAAALLEMVSIPRVLN